MNAPCRAVARASLVALILVAGGAVMSPSRAVATTYPSRLLSPIDLFNDVSVAHGRLLLSGEVASTTYRTTPTCVSATVDPQTLAIGAKVEARCDDPAVYGERVGADNDYLSHSNNATIRVARVDEASGSMSMGPVVMTYGSYSDTRPVLAYGGAWFWIYDNTTYSSVSAALDAPTQGRAELLQVSVSSGQVVDSVAMPKLFRPIMAANDDGLWLGNSLEGGTCAGCSAPDALYHVAPGSRKVVVTMAARAHLLCWLLGSEHDLWFGVGRSTSGCADQTLWRLEGSDPRPVFLAPEESFGPNVVVGDALEGLWSVRWAHHPRANSSAPLAQEIVGFNPDSGAATVVATLPARVVPPSDALEGLVQGQAVVYHGYLYLLEPPFEQRGYLGYRSLVRVHLASGTASSVAPRKKNA